MGLYHSDEEEYQSKKIQTKRMKKYINRRKFKRKRMMNYIIRTKKNINGKRFQTKANDELYHSDGENINQGEFSRKRMNHIIRTEKRKYINRRRFNRNER